MRIFLFKTLVYCHLKLSSLLKFGQADYVFQYRSRLGAAQTIYHTYFAYFMGMQGGEELYRVLLRLSNYFLLNSGRLYRTKR